MKVGRGQKGGALNASDQCPYRKRERQQRERSPCLPWREGHGEPREKAAEPAARTTGFTGNQSGRQLRHGHLASGLGEIHVRCLSHTWGVL